MSSNIVCDVDGVLCDAVGPWVRAYEKQTGEHVALDCYDLGSTVRSPDLLYQVLHEQCDEIYARGPTELGRAILAELLQVQRRTGVAVTFCTYAPPSDLMWAREAYVKLVWLQTFVPRGLEWSYCASASSAKLQVAGDLIVEDCAEKAVAWAEYHCAERIIVAQPWNVGAPGRIENAEQFRAAMRRVFP